MAALRTSRSSLWDNRLLLSILALLTIPAVYRSYSVYLIGNTPPNQYNLAIVAQWQFVQVAVEVLQEALVFPLFYWVGSQFHADRATAFSRVKSGLWLMVCIVLPVCVLLEVLMPHFVRSIDTNAGLVDLSVQFLRVRTLSLGFSLIAMGLLVMVEALRKSRWIWELTGLKLILSVALDSLFFGGYSFSLGWGVMGLAWSQLLVEVGVTLFIGWRVFQYFGLPLRAYLQRPFFTNWSVFGPISGWIGLESLVRNLAYSLLILRLLNSLGPEPMSAYFLVMHLFWSFGLVPINALAEAMRVFIANAASEPATVKAILVKGCRWGGGVLLLWLPALYFVPTLLAFFTDDPEVVGLGRLIIYYLFPAYLFLALNMLVDTLFIGLGKTRYLAYQSLWTNLIVYGLAYLFYHFGYWTPDLVSIMVLFNVGILVDSVLTGWYAWRTLRALPAKHAKEA